MSTIKFFFASSDIQLPVFVHPAVIAGIEPAVPQAFGGQLWLLVVTEHDDVALYADFTVAVRRDVFKFDLAAGKRNAYGVPVVERVVICADKR